MLFRVLFFSHAVISSHTVTLKNKGDDGIDLGKKHAFISKRFPVSSYIFQYLLLFFFLFRFCYFTFLIFFLLSSLRPITNLYIQIHVFKAFFFWVVVNETRHKRKKKKKQHTRFQKYADNERLIKIHSKYNNNNNIEKDFWFLFHLIFQRSVFSQSSLYILLFFFCFFFFSFFNFKNILVSVSYLLIIPNNYPWAFLFDIFMFNWQI